MTPSTPVEARVQALMKLADDYALTHNIAASHALESAIRAEVSGKDAERLDYLQKRGATVHLTNITKDGFSFCIGGWFSATHPDIRVAIDAAVQSTKEKS